MLNNIPLELRQLPQWVCVDMTLDDRGLPRKFPINPRDGKTASVTDPSTWGTFDECVRTGFKTIGFVFTKDDPYTVIDLDDKDYDPATPEQKARQAKILELFDTYTERSISGKGFHIIARGWIGAGLKRDKVEVYSHSRYMIMTGNVTRQAPITDQQELLNHLTSEMRPQSVDIAELEEKDELISDQDLVSRAMYAENGEKFTSLCNGLWQDMGYPSQSEADYALLAILAFYTPSNEQVRRIFRMSRLGKREKAVKNNDYLNRCLKKIRTVQAPLIDVSAFTSAPRPSAPVPLPPVPAPVPMQAPVPVPPVPLPPRGPGRHLGALALPPGLVGDVANYIFAQAVRPVPEVALAGALALVAGVAGRSYNISGTGLNQYLILLAKTGSGKEGAATGIDNLISATKSKVPMVDQFVGPAAFASGQSLVRVLDKQQCFLSVLGEFGLTLQQVCDPRANAAQIMLKKVLLDLYAKSGWNKVLRPSVYADVEKNTNSIQAPNVSILGESTPESFYNGLDTMHIAEGLIPRFSIIEYTGPRPARNPNAHVPPSDELVEKFAELVANCITMSHNHSCAPVQTDSTALSVLDQFDLYCDKKINTGQGEVEIQLWNRAHLKALKLAALIAVGVNMLAPVVTKEIAEWAVEFVKKDVNVISSRFATGQVGTGEHRFEEEIRVVVKDWFSYSEEQKLKYQCPKALLGKDIVPYTFLRRRLRLLASFKNDKRGPARALDESLADMCKAEILQAIAPAQAQAEFGVRTDLYVKGRAW